MSSNRTFHGGGGGDGVSNYPTSVDGVFQVISQDKEPSVIGEESDDGDAELTYNSQGKPIPKPKVA